MQRTLMAAALIPLLLQGCAVDHYVLHDVFAEAHGRHVNEKQYRVDVKNCGDGPGAEWCRLAADDGNLSRDFLLETKPLPRGTTYAYDASQCAGSFDHGLCRGVSRPRPSATPACHGETIDGQCAGPTF